MKIKHDKKKLGNLVYMRIENHTFISLKEEETYSANPLNELQHAS